MELQKVKKTLYRYARSSEASMFEEYSEPGFTELSKGMEYLGLLINKSFI